MESSLFLPSCSDCLCRAIMGMAQMPNMPPAPVSSNQEGTAVPWLWVHRGPLDRQPLLTLSLQPMKKEAEAAFLPHVSLAKRKTQEQHTVAAAAAAGK